MPLLVLFVFMILGNHVWAVERLSSNSSEHRNEKLLSLFSIVSFANEECQSTSSLNGGFRNGTCFTADECSQNGGSASGSCAAGFGVCCIFATTTCGATVTQNCTYLQNPNFPNVFTDTTPCAYTVNRVQQNICQLRLDFETFTILGPAGTAEVNGGACQDMFTITGLSSNQAIPVICGSNSNQHLYVDIGSEASNTAMLNFAFMGNANVRTWEIKVSQIPCGANFAAPNGCLQYHIGTTGRIETFNFADAAVQAHLANQQYSVCLRQEEGFCCNIYSVCPDANSFTLFADNANPVSSVDTQCFKDYVGIAGSTGSSCIPAQFSSRYCGGFFNNFSGGNANVQICDCTTPFIVDIRTDNMNDGANQISRGTCLMYAQKACMN